MSKAKKQSTYSEPYYWRLYWTVSFKALYEEAKEYVLLHAFDATAAGFLDSRFDWIVQDTPSKIHLEEVRQAIRYWRGELRGDFFD